MREKRWLLMLTLTLLLGATMASVPVPPAKATYSAVRVYIVPLRPGNVSGKAVGVVFDVEVYIETPPEWTNTSNGIVGWRMDVHVNASVLEPMTVTLGLPGYWLYDFTQDYYYYGHEPTYGFTVDKPGGDFDDIGIFLKGFLPPEGIGVGAGGSGLICKLKYKSKSLTAWTLIDLIDFKYARCNFQGEEDWITADLAVIDGNYNTPPYLFLHSTSSLIDLTSPVCTYWHELWPSYCTEYHLGNWIDTNEDSQLSPCDTIKLDSTWYHVEEVTVTIYTHTAYADVVTSTNSPSSTSTPDATGWTNPTGAYADGGTSASITSAKPSDRQDYGGYGFAIPTTATISQVRVRLDAWSGKDEYIYLEVSEDGGATWLASQWFNATTASEVTYWADVTGWTSWTPAKINSDNIRTRVWAHTQGGASTVDLDWIPIEVTYLAPFPMYIEFLDGYELYMDQGNADPNRTIWHEIYPVPSNKYNLTDWTDTDATGNVTVTDYIDLKNSTGGVNTYLVEDIDTDIIVSGPIPEQPEFPLGFAIEISLIVAVIYICWRSRRKTKITKSRITAPLKQ